MAMRWPFEDASLILAKAQAVEDPEFHETMQVGLTISTNAGPRAETTSRSTKNTYTEEDAGSAPTFACRGHVCTMFGLGGDSLYVETDPDFHVTPHNCFRGSGVGKSAQRCAKFRIRCSGWFGRVTQQGLVVQVPGRGRGHQYSHYVVREQKQPHAIVEGVALGGGDVAQRRGRGPTLPRDSPPCALDRVWDPHGRWPARARTALYDDSY
jgi:hypothetical protein